MDSVFNRLDALSSSAAFHLERTKVIQGNIANADTPDYKPKDVIFSQHLDDAMALKRTDAKHIGTDAGGGMKTVTLENTSGYDHNRVNLDEEMSKLAESSIMYKSMVESMKKEITKLNLVITGR